MENNIYLLPIIETISTAWQKVKGSKATFLASIAIVILIKIAFIWLSHMTISLPIVNIIITIIDVVIYLLLIAGLLYLGIRRAFGLPITYPMMFTTFRTEMALKVIGILLLKLIIIAIPVFLTLLLSILLTAIFGSMEHILKFLLVLLYIACLAAYFYLILRLFLGVAFVLDKNATPLQAIKLSFQATQSNVWHLVGLFIIQQLILIISIAPFGIGLFWTFPFLFILYGTLYKNLLANVKNF